MNQPGWEEDETKRVIFHTDRGSVYTYKDYAKLCTKLGVTQSMGAVGTSADNALAESFNATLKREVLQDATSCRREVFRWVTRYNTRRRHSWCRYHSPSTYETLHACYAPHSRVINPRVQVPGVKPPRPEPN